MKFYVDAQLPRHLSASLKWSGHDALHTLDLPSGNCTPDSEINYISIEEHRIVVTKDADFVNSFLLSEVPYKMLLVSMGNLNNLELEELFSKNLSAIVAALEIYDFVKITRTSLIEHK